MHDSKRLNVESEVGEVILLRLSPTKVLLDLITKEKSKVQGTFHDSGTSGKASLPTCVARVDENSA
jgi:hypothetical protein